MPVVLNGGVVLNSGVALGGADCECCGPPADLCCSIPDASTFQCVFSGISVSLGTVYCFGLFPNEEGVSGISCTPNNTYCANLFNGPPSLPQRTWLSSNSPDINCDQYSGLACGFHDGSTSGANAAVWCDGASGLWYVAFAQVSSNPGGCAFYGTFSWDCSTSPITVNNLSMFGALTPTPDGPTITNIGIGTGGTCVITFNGC